MKREQMRTWAEIDLDALVHNYRALCSCAPSAKGMGVVKANAYGHGAVQVAGKLEEIGADYLAVAALEEALELRAAGISLPILILGVTPVEFASDVIENNITQTVISLETAKAWSDVACAMGKSVKVHVKADTGMSRLGMLASDLEGTSEEIAKICACSALEVEGIFTHFASADVSEEYTMGQITRFMDLVDRLENVYNITFKIRHCAASSGVLFYPCAHFDMIRLGISLYGHYPCPEAEGLDGPGLKPVMTLKSRVVSVKNLPAGSVISYGGTYTLTRDSRIAVLPIGYADGLLRTLSGRMEVLLNGKRAPQIGRICMDCCMIDVTDLPDVKVGDVAEVFGAELPLREKTEVAKTIEHEMLCAVSRRVPRIY